MKIQTETEPICLSEYTCPRNEEWKECGEAPYCEAICGYQGRNCDDSIQCPGCFCRKGYYRHPETYACVTYNQCPSEEPQCPAGEVYKSCGYSKDEQCQFYGGDYYSEKCKPGCYCINGYVRIDGQCVPKYKCPKLCPANEEYSSCGNSCKESCSTTDSDCHKPCESGCFCIAGYKRVDGVCVQKSYCPPPKCQGPNEIYIPCGKSCYEDCSKTPKDCSYETCTSGCYCKTNYKRINGECVLKEYCPPPECPVHEVYSSCGNPCHDECGKAKSDCQSGMCYAGCYCEKGFKRIDGICIPESKCESSSTKCEGQNEIYKKCGKSCYEDCSKSQKDCLYETCYSGCFCKPRYKRVDGACVPEKECPPSECPPYEVYITCGNSCYDECGKIKSDCQSGKCYEGCYCQDGYKRIDGVCVPEFKCEPVIPKCQGQNEIYKKCGKTCYEDCSKTQKDCYYEACTSGCFCKPNFKRVDGSCVPEDECPPPECPANEVYITCGNSCYDECGKSKSDCQSGKCYQGCYCQDGYKRIDGVCVPKFKCEPLIPKCQGQNEIYKKCGKTCYEDCSKTQKDCFYETCFSGCFCKPNFKRVDGECVPQEECPAPECPVYEVYSTCGNSCYDECGKTKSDCQSDKCFAGCYCQRGFKRIDGVCVPEYKCGPPKCLLPNEVYKKCGRICDDQCDSVHYKCLRENCFSGCFCAEGYKRIEGACLPESTCPPAPCGPNEIYSKCGRKCDEECNIFNGPCKTELCYPGCFCQEGFTRINGSCVPESLCKCPYNERYAYSSECSEHCLAKPMDCEGALETFRCSCKDGFKRINGLCLDENLCQCSENEKYAYGNPCQEKCGVGPQKCKDEDSYKGCFCREGYRRVSGKCITESQCPCGKYEEYNYGNDCYEECSKDPKLCRSVETYKKCTCIEGYKRIYGYCMPDTKCKCLVNEIVTYSNDCYEQCGTDPAKCAEQDTIRGCACRPGYVRINGQCVPDSKCPCSFKSMCISCKSAHFDSPNSTSRNLLYIHFRRCIPRTVRTCIVNLEHNLHRFSHDLPCRHNASLLEAIRKREDQFHKFRSIHFRNRILHFPDMDNWYLLGIPH
uniref:EGF-like domain-containing protein n=1 Tax=Phlebotomus papatasi TaxID=29031 RepID=A0A1B0D4C2_PHLPP